MAADPYVSNVELLCNYDGGDGDTFYTSEIGPDPDFFGVSEIDTAISEFAGGGSLLLTGAIGVYNSFGANADWNWIHDGSESWTLEAIVYPTLFNGGFKSIFDTYNTSNQTGIQFGYSGSTSGTISLKLNNGLNASTGGLTLNTWHLIAATYDVATNKYTCHKRRASGSYTAELFPKTRTAKTADSDKLRVGWHRAGGTYLYGNVDCVRVTRGIIRDVNYWPAVPWDGTISFTAYMSAPFIFSSPTLITYANFSSQVEGAISTYIMEISGTPILRIPISSWQATSQLDNVEYLQCVVPAVDDYATDISERQGSSNFAIYRTSVIDGYEHNVKLVEAPLTSASFAQGRINYTCSISGYSPAASEPTLVVSHNLLDVRSVQTSATGTFRIRSAIDWLVRPGDTVVYSAYSFKASFINYYANESDAYMDVGSRVEPVALTDQDVLDG